jgi:hypothetical protein
VKSFKSLQKLRRNWPKWNSEIKLLKEFSGNGKQLVIQRMINLVHQIRKTKISSVFEINIWFRSATLNTNSNQPSSGTHLLQAILKTKLKKNSKIKKRKKEKKKNTKKKLKPSKRKMPKN